MDKKLLISIHALREEGDPCSPPSLHIMRRISIHALREEGDRLIAFVLRAVTLFLSTPSARRATTAIFAGKFLYLISIHALREEGDRNSTD